MRYPTAVFVLLLAGCGAASPPARPVPTPTPTPAATLAPLPAELPDRITGQRLGPWGARINQWQVDGDGTLRLTMLDSGAQPVKLRTIRFTRRGAIAELRGILAPVERQALTSSDCPPAATDQGFAHIEWSYGKGKAAYQLDDGCEKPEAAPMGQAIDAAEAAIIAWGRAAANPKVEDNPQ